MDDQAAVDDAEWRRPENWTAGIYRSKRDSRLLVPKRNPRYGQTINFAHPRSGLLLLGLSSVPLGFLLLWILHAIDK
jgi:uncharacterized membrane protein